MEAARAALEAAADRTSAAARTMLFMDHAPGRIEPVSRVAPAPDSDLKGRRISVQLAVSFRLGLPGRRVVRCFRARSVYSAVSLRRAGHASLHVLWMRMGWKRLDGFLRARTLGGFALARRRAIQSVVVAAIRQTRTERVLEALRDLTSPHALVIGDGGRKRMSGRRKIVVFATRDVLEFLLKPERLAGVSGRGLEPESCPGLGPAHALPRA